MTIRPILSALLRNRTGATLVVAQIALTLAIVVNALFIIQQRLKFIDRPSGMDIENIVVVGSQGFGDDYDHNATMREDLDIIRAIPGVIAATTINSMPLSGSGSANGFSAGPEDDAPSAPGNYYLVNEQGQDTLGFELYAGRFFTPEEIQEGWAYGDAIPHKVVITKTLAEQLFDTPDAVGKLIYNGVGETSEVVGIVEHMLGSWVSWDNLANVALFPTVHEGPYARIAVRVEPGLVDEMVPKIEEALLATGARRIIASVQPMMERVNRSYSGDKAVAAVLVVVVFLLFAVAGLGIVGLASFTVNQRTKQIGTRRAIGARKRDIITYFVTENWLLTTIGVALGAVLTVLLNVWMSSQFGLERLNLLYVPVGIVALWLLGLVAVAGPARRASRISPAIATRTV